MGYLFKLLPINNIKVDVDLSSKRRVFDEAGLLFEESLGISRQHVFDAFLEREKMGSTALGNGIAIPHGRIDSLKKSTSAFIRSSNGIPFEARIIIRFLFFFLMVPSNATEMHLQILSELSQLFGTQTVVKKSKKAKIQKKYTKYFLIGRVMPKVSITKLFEDNEKSLELGWVITPKSKKIILDSNEINHSAEGLIGNLNLTHPNWIQIFSKTEAHYFQR